MYVEGAFQCLQDCACVKTRSSVGNWHIPLQTDIWKSESVERGATSNGKKKTTTTNDCTNCRDGDKTYLASLCVPLQSCEWSKHQITQDAGFPGLVKAQSTSLLLPDVGAEVYIQTHVVDIIRIYTGYVFKSMYWQPALPFSNTHSGSPV